MALLLLVSGSTVVPEVATLAVLARLLPGVAPAATVTDAVNVELSPLRSVTVPVRALPEPAAVQLEPTAAVHVQVLTVRDAGKVSVNGPAETVLGPALVTTIV